MVLKLKLPKNHFNKCAPKFLFFNEKKIRRIWMIIDVENSLWKSNFGALRQCSKARQSGRMANCARPFGVTSKVNDFNRQLKMIGLIATTYTKCLDNKTRQCRQKLRPWETSRSCAQPKTRSRVHCIAVACKNLLDQNAVLLL